MGFEFPKEGYITCGHGPQSSDQPVCFSCLAQSVLAAGGQEVSEHTRSGIIEAIKQRALHRLFRCPLCNLEIVMGCESDCKDLLNEVDHQAALALQRSFE